MINWRRLLLDPEVRQPRDQAELHELERARWKEEKAVLLARIGDLTDDLTESIDREAS